MTNIRNETAATDATVSVTTLAQTYPDALNKHVVLQGDANITVLKEGLPDSITKAFIDCDTLAKYYASSRCASNLPEWPGHYRRVLKATGWTAQNQKVDLTRRDVKATPSLAAVTSLLITRSDYPDLAEVVEYNLFKISNDPMALKKFCPTHPSKLVLFKIIAVEKQESGETALIVAAIIAREGKQQGSFSDLIGNLVEHGAHYDFGAFAWPYLFDNVAHEEMKPVIAKHLDSIARTGHTELTFGRS
jgi:hypothetical protein